jgi:hypothetical protein
MSANQMENVTNDVEISLENQLQREKEIRRSNRLARELREKIEDILMEMETKKRERAVGALSSEGAERGEAALSPENTEGVLSPKGAKGAERDTSTLNLEEIKDEKINQEKLNRERMRKREIACYDFWKSFQQTVERYDKNYVMMRKSYLNLVIMFLIIL